MSLFLIHQDSDHAVIVADALASKPYPSGKAVLPLSAPKLAHVASGIYAAHAGTWQPAWAMLSDLHELIMKGGARINHTRLLKQMQTIGARRYSEFQKRFQTKEIDVRIGLVVTGRYRAPGDIKTGLSSTILLWEAARNFVPLVVRGHLHFAGNPELSELVTHTLGHPLTQRMLSQGPLSAARVLISAQRLAQSLSASISEGVNAVIVGRDDEHSIIEGTMIKLPMSALIRG